MIGFKGLVSDLERGRISRRSFIKTALVMGVSGPSIISALAACSSAAPQSGGTGKAGGQLVVGIESEIDVLDPHTHGGWVTFRNIRSVFESLVDKDLSKAGDQVTAPQIVPALAKEWTISPDGTEYTFKLRENVKFHDGTPFNAEAVKFNYDRFVDKAAPQFYDLANANTSWFAQYIKATTVVDPLTVKITLNEPFSDFLDSMAEGGLGSHKILSPDSWKKWQNKDIGEHPVGTGPFKFVERVRGDRVIFERNQDYWGNKSKVDRLVIKPLPEPAARTTALQTGEVDLIYAPIPDTLASLQKAGYVVAQGPTPHVWWLIFNMDHPEIGKNLKLRQAISMGINRKGMAEQLLKNTVKVARGLQAPGCPSYDPNFPEYPYDPEGAKKLLAEAGYPNGLKLVYQSSTAGSGQLIPVQMNEFIQADLRKIGIDLKLDLYEWITYVGTWVKGMPPDIAFNQQSWGMSANYWLEIVTHPKNNPPSGCCNVGHIKDTDVAQALDDARKATDKARSNQLYQKANKLIYDNALAVGIINDLAPLVYNKKVQGLVHAPAEWYDYTAVTVS